MTSTILVRTPGPHLYSDDIRQRHTLTSQAGVQGAVQGVGVEPDATVAEMDAPADPKAAVPHSVVADCALHWPGHVAGCGGIGNEKICDFGELEVGHAGSVARAVASPSAERPRKISLPA
jgi:hypothetical protein